LVVRLIVGLSLLEGKLENESLIDHDEEIDARPDFEAALDREEEALPVAVLEAKADAVDEGDQVVVAFPDDETSFV
jgi:hypothetical protein